MGTKKPPEIGAFRGRSEVRQKQLIWTMLNNLHEPDSLKREEEKMKIRELQEQLGKLDPELKVLCYSEDEKLLSEGRGFILFDVSAVSTTEAEMLRLDDGTPYLKFGKGPTSVTIATLEITSDL